MYGLYCCDFGNKQHEDVSFGNRAKIIEERIQGRVQPLHFGVNYHEEPLEFTLIFGGDEPIDRYDMQTIARWLTGHQQYQWLTIEEPDMTSLHFRCLIRELTPISVGWFQYAFSADVICDCPYAYSNLFEQSFELPSSGSKRVILRNYGTARECIRPKIAIKDGSSEGVRNLRIINHTTGNVMTFTGMPAGRKKILIDCNTGIVTGNIVTTHNEGGVVIIVNEDGEEIIQEDDNEVETQSSLDMYPYFNFEYIEMEDGDNDLEIIGDNKALVVFTGRYLHNVGA